jgi:H+-transporting ATPase
MALQKFSAPVPWMLEAAIVLEVVLGKYIEASIIGVLLVFNAALGLIQESRAQATLTALKSPLALNASVRRDNVWTSVPATDLVPGDIIKLSLGAVVAADVQITSGEVLLDQSMLTGESVPVEAGSGVQSYAGALVRRGEAIAQVTATGANTKFGGTEALIRDAHVIPLCLTAGVLPTRLSAVDEAGSMDVLCADKTGTLISPRGRTRGCGLSARPHSQRRAS